jgi:DNA-binding transcriptional ArsR family regulator
MNLSRPYAILRRGIDTEVVRVLAGTNDAMTGRQVERLVGHGSHRTVQLSLARLAGEGLLDMREYGPSKLYTFNREHLAAEPVLALLGIRARLLELLRTELQQWQTEPAHASLFGSAARGDGNEESDIDLLVVRPDRVDGEDERWRGQVEQLRQAVSRWTGNRAAISELSEADVRALVTDEPPVLAQLHEDAIVLAGPRLSSYARSLT